MKEIIIAHSPDADDIFMYYAIKFGWVEIDNVNIKNVAEDIETLNQKVLNGLYEISAISFALYPYVKDSYALLRTAISFGYGYGPKLMKLKNKKLSKKFKVALSGKYTTNALLFKIQYPQADIVYMNFLEIENAILSKKVDAGVLIHESILQYDDRLEVERELWDIWCSLTKQKIPLPLGGMVIKRSIPLLKAIKYEELLTKATKMANLNKSIISKMLLQRRLVRVDSKNLKKYLNMYANSSSISINDEQLDALNILYQIGYDHKFYKQKLDIKEYLIPKEYKEVRYGS